MVYGAAAPARPDAVEAIDELVDEHGVGGIKFYPADIVDGVLTPVDLGDEKVCFPVIERARARGLKVIALHKAMPLGPTPVQLMTGRDVEVAAAAFPDMTFEIVHGGLAFLDETALELECYPNIYINLLIRGYRYPELTREVKEKILGLNFAAMHGLDIAALREATATDEFALRTELAAPWSAASRVAEAGRAGRSPRPSCAGLNEIVDPAASARACPPDSSTWA
jgi:predicted TIM-barrel fold metal-dependent hydrolase